MIKVDTLINANSLLLERLVSISEHYHKQWRSKGGANGGTRPKAQALGAH